MRLKIYRRVIWIVLPVFAFPVSGAVANASADPTIPISGTVQAPIRSLDEVMVSLLHKINCTAGALAISKGDTLLYERSYGWLDREHKIPAPVNAYFGLASCEKPITAAAVRKLAAEGKLNLDAPLFATLGIRPAGKVVDQRVNDITFEHVLDMKAGWGGDIHDELVKDAQASGATPPFTIPVLLAQVMPRPLLDDPGKVENYSNFGFDTLRYVVAVESHKQPGFYYRERLLLRSSCKDVGQPEELSPEQQTSRAVWNLKDGGPIFSSARYLCLFMDEYWYTGKPRDHDRPLWVKYGSLPGSTSVMVWRQDGINIAAIFNGRNQTTNDEVRTGVENIVNQNLTELMSR
jgi:CubicO group peptidase (beta-lactamase class C family)